MYSVGELRASAADAGAGLEAGSDADAGACGDTTSDPQNCGACGHGCLGQPCRSGTCAAAVLASGQDDPRSIVVDETNVYWGSAGAGGVWSCDKACAMGPSKVADEPAPVVALAMTKFYVFWAKAADVKRLTKSSGEIVGVDNGVVANLVALAADEASFTWTNSDATGGVARCPVAGCDMMAGPDVLADGYERPAALAIAPGGFAFAAGNPSRAILYCSPRCVDPDAGLAVTIAESQPEPGAIALDATSAFWTNALAAPNAAVVRAALAAPHAPTTLANLDSPGPLVLDGGFVYTIGQKDGSLHRVPQAGGDDVVLARGLDAPRALAVDDRRVWVANGGPNGSIVWVAK